jgi:hypothetical protein
MAVVPQQLVISCDRKTPAYRMRGPLAFRSGHPSAVVGGQGTMVQCLLVWLRKIVDCVNLRMFLGL